MESNSLFNDFDIELCVQQMRSEGGATVPNFLRNEVQLALLRELSEYQMRKAPNEYGPHNTRQVFSAVSLFPEHSLFTKVRAELGTFLEIKLRECSLYPLVEPLHFNEIVVHRYPPGPLGISPHRDGESVINLVALLVLEGEGRFCYCDDRPGNNPRPCRNEPGDLLLMRAPGFLGEDIQPFHFVDTITAQRTTFALRQRKN